jgi:hypothetical protein
MTKKYKVDLIPGDVESVRENTRPIRVAPVDLDQFAGMTPGEWIQDGGTNKDGDLFVWKAGNYFGHGCVAKVKNDIFEGARVNAVAIAALPDIISDLKATREENTKLRKALREFLDCMDDLTTDEFSKGGERIPRENARQLLTELGEPTKYTHGEATL